MPLDFRGALSSAYKNALTVYSKALCFLGIGMTMTQTAYTELPSHDSPISTKTFRDNLLTQYRADGSDRMNKLFVTEVRLCKKTDSPQHEYLTATICTPDRDFIAYLSFERFRGSIVANASPSATPSENPLISQRADFPQEPEGKSPLATFLGVPNRSRSLLSIHSASTVAAISSDSLLDERYANDRVGRLLSPSLHDSDVHLILSFKAKRLLLWELAVLADVVHDSAEKYHIIKGNCYFYVGTVVPILKELYSPEVKEACIMGSKEHDAENMTSPRMRNSNRGRNRRSSKARRTPGTWNNVPIYPAGGDTDVSLRPIMKMFEEEKEAFTAPVRERDREAELARSAVAAEERGKAAEERAAQASEAHRRAMQEIQEIRKAHEERELVLQRQVACLTLKLENERMTKAEN